MKRKHYLQQQRTEQENSSREGQLQHNIFFVARVVSGGCLFGLFAFGLFSPGSKEKKWLDVALHMPDATMRSNPFLGKELLHRVFDFERARAHCL